MHNQNLRKLHAETSAGRTKKLIERFSTDYNLFISAYTLVTQHTYMRLSQTPRYGTCISYTPRTCTLVWVVEAEVVGDEGARGEVMAALAMEAA